jgi:hypothetical protein
MTLAEPGARPHDYGDVLDWYGLRFMTSDGPAGRWTLEIRSDATAAQERPSTTGYAGARAELR